MCLMQGFLCGLSAASREPHTAVPARVLNTLERQGLGTLRMLYGSGGKGRSEAG